MSDNACPCGLDGENCDQLVFPLNNANLAKECIFSQTDECVVSDNEAVCECVCGFAGDICDERLSPGVGNLIIGYFIAVGIVVLAAGLIPYYENKRTDTDNRQKSAFIQSRLKTFSPKVILAYRMVNFIIFWPVAIDFAVTKPDDFLSFSLINWVLFGVFNLVGSVLSFKGLREISDDKESIGVVEKLFEALQAVILPSSFFLSVVFWLIIVPGANDDDIGRLTRPSQFFVHGVNVLLLSIEFFYNGTFIRKSQLTFIFIFSGLYLVFHQFLIVYFEARREAPCPIYDFLDMSQDIYIVFVLGLLFAFSAVFFMSYGISVLKKKRFENN